MITPDYARTMAAYNRWMNDRLYAACATLSDTERKRDRGAFFGSIHGTLNHLLHGDRAWLGRFTGRDLGCGRLGETLYEDFETLRAERARTDAEIGAWTTGLDRDRLAADFRYTSNVDGITRVLPTWVLVAHLFNHQTHHRGQLTTLLSQLGVDYGVTDLPWLPGLATEVGSGRTDG